MDVDEAASRLAAAIEPANLANRIVEVFRDPRWVGLEAHFEGELLGMPEWVELDEHDRLSRERSRERLRAAFRRACGHLRPMYAGIAIEWELPSPISLTDGRAWLPGDCFWARQLDASDPN